MEKLKKKSWKTTACAVAKVVTLVSGAIAAHLDMDPETVVEVGAVLYGVVEIVQGYFTRDKDVSSEAEGVRA